MMKHIYLRVDGNEKIGLGHIMRCISIAKALQKKELECTFIMTIGSATKVIEEQGFNAVYLHSTYDEMEAEIAELVPILAERRPAFLMVDSYYVTPEYLRQLRRWAPVVYLDDLNAFDYPADLVINYNLYGPDLPYAPGKRYLLGARYAPLRSEFADRSALKKSSEKLQILISTGGSDPIRAAPALIRRLMGCRLWQSAQFHLVVGELNPCREELERYAQKYPQITIHYNVIDMARLMSGCDMAISAAGSTLYELCACGVPTVTYTLADNQLMGAAAFAQKGLMLCAGDGRGDGNFADRIVENAMRLAEDAALRERMAQAMRGEVDGKGAERIAKEILRCIPKGMFGTR